MIGRNYGGREHSARLLKGLFDKGLVVRDDSAKPYVYELADGSAGPGGTVTPLSQAFVALP